MLAPPSPPKRALALLNAQLTEGAPLDLNVLERALLLADELPGLRATGSLQAGGKPGSTDVLLQLAPTPRLRPPPARSTTKTPAMPN